MSAYVFYVPIGEVIRMGAFPSAFIFNGLPENSNFNKNQQITISSQFKPILLFNPREKRFGFG